ncbi:dihydrofolate reductase [Cubamyces lactineus]|nr:dihydrofolate reductase [Cubamyces lactineus]
MPRLTIVVAATRNNGIGRNSQLPWRLSKEMAFFKKLTTTSPEGTMNAVIMGRATWESISKKFRPLPQRINVVISRNKQYERMPADAGTPSAPAYLHSSIESAAERLAEPRFLEKPLHRSFVIGGAHIYDATLALPPTSDTFVDRILLTRILSPAFEDCDVFFPDFLADSATEGGKKSWKRASFEGLMEWAGFDVPEGIQEENGVQYEFQMWVR